MDNAPAFECEGVFRLMELPLELRRRIYHFAVAEPHPLPLIAYCKKFGNHIIWTVEKDLGMLETCKDFLTQMEDMLYSENSFSTSSPDFSLEEETTRFQIDPRRIQKLYISVVRMNGWNSVCDDPDSGFFSEVPWFQYFVATLVFKGHQLKYLLVECKPHVTGCLMEGLSPLSMLRRVRRVHFRSWNDELFPYFRLLEGLMMGGQPQYFSDMPNFWQKSTDFDECLLKHPEQSWFMKGLDKPTSAVVQCEEQMEVTAKELHYILGIDGDFVPRDKAGPSDTASTAEGGPDGRDEMFMQDSAGGITSRY
ncbi:hypothetical protein IMSHALPRED_001192 [Imshaugia aleurites]|uniref:Uncharacterized protein n=1 Tax=Imshaugia aleurites TaxID=172621 RepID=A0A8H3PED9_9LECA|nr:hypothetical protein IMSHALPRED_001192 [Imshaugia aleurites]